MNDLAIVYDWMDKWGGVERLLLTLHEMYPDAPFYTAHHGRGARWASGIRVTPSFMQKLPDFMLRSRLLSLPFYPYAFESFDFSSYRTVLSVTSSFGKGVLTKPGTRHISYILTPTRYLWSGKDSYKTGVITRLGVAVYGKRLREWDYIAAARPDEILTLSQAVRSRIQRYYRRESTVVYPPFDTDYWTDIETAIGSHNPERSYYLIVSRLEPYKSIHTAVEAMTAFPGERLVIVGAGSQLRRLRSIAGPNVEFAGTVDDVQLGKYYKGAKAILMPQEEDFGYTSLEAQFFGCPVIAYNRGGAAETVEDGKTGLLYDNPTPEGLKNTLEIFHTVSYNITTGLQKRPKLLLNRFEKRSFVRTIRDILKH